MITPYPSVVVISHAFHLGWSEASPIGYAIAKRLSNLGFVLPHTNAALVRVQDAYVVSDAAFEEMAATRQFLVTETVIDVKHGIADSTVQDVVRSGRIPLMIIRPRPAAELKEKLGDSMTLIQATQSPEVPGASEVWAAMVNEVLQPQLFS